MYTIYLNGELHSRTHEKTFNIVGLSKGDHEITVVDEVSGATKTLPVSVAGKAKERMEKAEDITKELSEDDLEPYKGKAGWYTFGDGHKVRGVEAALEYLQSLQ